MFPQIARTPCYRIPGFLSGSLRNDKHRLSVKKKTMHKRYLRGDKNTVWVINCRFCSYLRRAIFTHSFVCRWGNTPAIDLLNLGKNEGTTTNKDLKLALVGMYALLLAHVQHMFDLDC